MLTRTYYTLIRAHIRVFSLTCTLPSRPFMCVSVVEWRSDCWEQFLCGRVWAQNESRFQFDISFRVLILQMVGELLVTIGYSRWIFIEKSFKNVQIYRKINFNSTKTFRISSCIFWVHSFWAKGIHFDSIHIYTYLYTSIVLAHNYPNQFECFESISAIFFVNIHSPLAKTHCSHRQ